MLQQTTGHPGISRSIDRLSEQERAERDAARAPRIAAAKAHWRRLAEQKKWDEVHIPERCFRFVPDAAENLRETDSYRAKVLEAVGLAGKDAAGYDHLQPEAVSYTHLTLPTILLV